MRAGRLGRQIYTGSARLKGWLKVSSRSSPEPAVRNGGLPKSFHPNVLARCNLYICSRVASAATSQIQYLKEVARCVRVGRAAREVKYVFFVMIELQQLGGPLPEDVVVVVQAQKPRELRLAGISRESHHVLTWKASRD